MITRLRINGFKNLNGVDIRFGPFTCIAGTNAVGKSNLFDAIRFLSELSSKPLIEAARSVRSEGQKASDIKDIFYKYGDTYSDRISFIIDMIIPSEAFDELGQKAVASITSVRYSLVLKYLQGEDSSLEIEKEELVPVPQTEAKEGLYFRCTPKWKKSVITGKKTTNFISTEAKENDDGTERLVARLHQDQTKGKPTDRIVSQLPRTVLSTVTAEYPTACVTRYEMKSWVMLQLEPSALRRSDDFEKRKTATLLADGAQIPATLFRLQNENPEVDIYQELANRLAALVEDVREITIDRDDKRELLTLMVRFKDGSFFPARALSDGTLRFLGLTVLEQDTRSGSVICLEEPENGIHPDKIAAILLLLQDISTDTSYPSDEENPLRQIILNTHSPLVVQQVPEESLLMAESRTRKVADSGVLEQTVNFVPLTNTWRTKIPNQNSETVSLGKLLSYLGSPSRLEKASKPAASGDFSFNNKRVIDRSDVSKIQLSFWPASDG